MIAFSTTFSFTQLYAIPNQGDVTSAPEDDLSSRWPSGGYLSSTDDLARLGRTMLSPGFGQLSEREARTVAAFFLRQ